MNDRIEMQQGDLPTFLGTVAMVAALGALWTFQREFVMAPAAWAMSLLS